MMMIRHKRLKRLCMAGMAAMIAAGAASPALAADAWAPVSYTHLTLPTIRLV